MSWLEVEWDWKTDGGSCIEVFRFMRHQIDRVSYDWKDHFLKLSRCSKDLNERTWRNTRTLFQKICTSTSVQQHHYLSLGRMIRSLGWHAVWRNVGYLQHLGVADAAVYSVKYRLYRAEWKAPQQQLGGGDVVQIFRDVSRSTYQKILCWASYCGCCFRQSLFELGSWTYSRMVQKEPLDCQSLNASGTRCPSIFIEKWQLEMNHIGKLHLSLKIRHYQPKTMGSDVPNESTLLWFVWNPKAVTPFTNMADRRSHSRAWHFQGSTRCGGSCQKRIQGGHSFHR